MSLISKEDYEEIAALYTDAVRQIQGVSDYYYAAANLIVDFDRTTGFEPTVDLIRPFVDAYKTSTGLYAEVPSTVVEAVKSLQQHVMKEARDGSDELYNDINDWLADNTIIVDAEFANISSRSGFVIDSDNIA